MSEEMRFPETLDEFIKQYSFIDDEKIYTNGSELIHVFRVKQWEEHKKQENQQLKNNWNELKKYLEEVINYIDNLEEQDSYDVSEKATVKNILNKMQELEKGKSE